MLVCLDPGHGGKDPGGCANGLQEKNLVLDIALRTRTLLEARGIQVMMTREKDEYVGITARHEMATRARANLFVSIHTDAYYESCHGFSILYYTAASRSTIGAIMREEMLAVYNDWNRWIYGNYAGVLVHATMPAILTENLFVTNKTEAAKLANPDFRMELAEAHAKAICRYFGVSYNEGDDEMGIAVYQFQQLVDGNGVPIKDDGRFVWLAPESFTKSYFFTLVNCWINIYNETNEPTEVLLWCNYEGTKEEWPVSIPLDKWQRHSINLENLIGIKDGASLIMKCASEKVGATVTLMCR